MALRSVLIVAADGGLRHVLSEQLSRFEGCEVADCGSGAEALALAAAGRFDLLLVDAGLPDMAGRALCRALRQGGQRAPIVMLTGADGDGVDSGADDHVAKPFRLGMLLARLRAQLRQHRRGEDVAFAIGAYSFRPSARLLVHDGNGARLPLTGKEAGILEFLYRAGGETVARRLLLERVWGYHAEAATHTLETHIYRLRQKIEDDPSCPRLLLTEPGGYRLELSPAGPAISSSVKSDSKGMARLA